MRDRLEFEVRFPDMGVHSVWNLSLLASFSAAGKKFLRLNPN
jgi:hypothetical protein